MFKNRSKLLIDQGPYFVVLLTAFILRFIDLGYSDYQGDEIKAFFILSPGKSAWAFLLDQRKGPVQFLITWALSMFDPTYENQFLMRFLFALSGFLAVLFFYKLVDMHFGKKVAFYSSFFFATNGFFVGLSRIVQYQPVGMFLMVLTLYFLTKMNLDPQYRLKGIYLGLISWALAILTHYDGVFIAPFVCYLVYRWFKTSELKPKIQRYHFIAASTVSALMLSVFYVPFVLTISDSTLGYWMNRIVQEQSNKISSSRVLFSFYQPIFILDIYTLLSLIGLVSLGIISLKRFKIGALFLNTKNGEDGPDKLPERFNQTTKLRGGWGAILGFFLNLFPALSKEAFQAVIFVVIWLLFPFVFMEVFVYNPGTHIYTYLMPLFIILGFGVYTIEYAVSKLGGKLGGVVNLLGVAVVFLFSFVQSYAIYVDHREEYPWENESFLIWDLSSPSLEFYQTYHLSVFGFPYFRNWEGIRDFTSNYPLKSYETNERKTISRFFVNLVEADEEGQHMDPWYYISVKNPQSFVFVRNPRINALITQYEPVYAYEVNGEPVAEVFYVTKEIIADLIER